MIQNGKDLNFGQSSSGLPSVQEAILNLFQPCTVGIIAATQVNGYTQTIVESYIQTRGVRIQDPNKLVFSKTGERIWDTLQIYLLPDVILEADDLFLFMGTQYRVVQITNWTEYGYNLYSVLQDYTKIYNLNPSLL